MAKTKTLPRNADVAEQLELLSDLLEIEGQPAFRVLAYRRAATRIRELGTPVAQLALEGKAKELQGIGVTIQEKIVQIVNTGEIEALTKRRKTIPPEVVEFLNIPGLGPKTVRRIWQELGVTTLAELKKYQLGGQATTTGVDYIKKTIKPSKKPREYSTTAAAAQALVVKQIDAFVIDVPIAAALVKQYPDDLTIVGQFVTNEQYGILFQKGSKLKPLVDEVIQEIKLDGTLERLQDKWFPGTASLPTIE